MWLLIRKYPKCTQSPLNVLFFMANMREEVSAFEFKIDLMKT